jgi:type I restriction enzyme S subunit
VPLGEVADYINGRGFKPKDWGRSGLPIIRIKNLTDPSAPFDYFKGDVADAHRVDTGDLLVSWSATLDAFIWDRGPAVVNQHIFKVAEYPDRVDRRYLYFALREAMAEIDKLVHGATMKHVTKPMFEGHCIPLPPLAEQERIAGRLTEQLGAVERARAAAAQRLAAAESLPAALLREVFNGPGATRDAGEVVGVRLAEVVDFIRGVSFDKADASYDPIDGHIPILRAGNIGDELTLDDDLVWVPPTRVDQVQMLQVGDLAICMSSGSPAVVGKTAQLRQPWRGSVGAFCGIIRARPVVHAGFLGYWFRSDSFRAWRDEQARGANIQNLRFSELGELEIPLPPLAEQERIAACLSAQLSAAEEVIARCREELAAIEALPAALLRQAFGGPSAPGDEEGA